MEGETEEETLKEGRWKVRRGACEGKVGQRMAVRRGLGGMMEEKCRLMVPRGNAGSTSEMRGS